MLDAWMWAREKRGKDGVRPGLKDREVDVPAGSKPVEWRPLTNRVASTLEQATELIDWYLAHWEIDVYFNVLKNGCEGEQLQLPSIDRLERALALFNVAPWRVCVSSQPPHL